MLALVIAAFACWCVVLVAPQRDLRDQLDARRGWFLEVNAVQKMLHHALSESPRHQEAALKEATTRLGKLENLIAADGEINPDVALTLTTRRGLVDELPVDQAVPAAMARGAAVDRRVDRPGSVRNAIGPGRPDRDAAR